MTNAFYNISGTPGDHAEGSSAAMRAEYQLIMNGFDKMPVLAANALKIVRINAGATALEPADSINNMPIGDVTPSTGVFTTLSATGNVTLGDAGGDALTINGATISLAGNPTISGNPTFSGNVATQGTLTVGNAAGDALTITSSAAAIPNGLSFTGGNVTVVGLTATGAVALNGGVTLGDAAGDALTINSSAPSIPNGLSFTGGNIAIAGAISTTSTARFNGATQGFLGVRESTGSGVAASTNADALVMDAASNTGMSFLTANNTSTTSIYFGDPESALAGRLAYLHGGDTMTFHVNDSLTLTLAETQTSINTQTASINRSIAGNVEFLATNNSNTASAAARFVAQVNSGTSSDPYFSAGINAGQFWTWGLDNSDSDAYVLSSGVALGTTNAIRVDAATRDVSLVVSGTTPRFVVTNAGDTVATAGLVLQSTGPTLVINETNGSVDAKTWLMRVNADNFSLRAQNDAGTVDREFLSVTRSGVAMFSIAYGNATDNPLHTFIGDLAVNRSSAGNVEGAVINTNVGVAAHAQLFISSGGGGAGDPKVVWNVVGVQEFSLGIDNSASDALVGSVGSALGTTNWLSVAANGAVTFPDADGVTVTGPVTFSANPAGNITSASYTPTLTNTLNVSASTVVAPFTTTRVGNRVQVTGVVTIDVTLGTTATQLEISLSPASNLGVAHDLVGIATRSGAALVPLTASILGDAANNTALVNFLCDATVSSQTYVVQFAYTII